MGTKIVPKNYVQEGAAFHVWFDEEDDALGAKEIVVIYIICLLVIGALIGIVYWYKQKKRGKATFDEAKGDEAGNNTETKTESSTKDGKGNETGDVTNIEMPTSTANTAPSVPKEDVKKSPLLNKTPIPNDPFKVA